MVGRVSLTERPQPPRLVREQLTRLDGAGGVVADGPFSPTNRDPVFAARTLKRRGSSMGHSIAAARAL